MAALSSLLAPAAASPITAIGNVLDQLFTSKEEKLSHEMIMAKLAMQPALAQIEINKIEASHRSVWVAGWRPAIGWVCALSISWQFVGSPLMEWWIVITGRDIQAPEIMADRLMELVLAMLGLSALRTAEKFGGRAK